MKDRNVPARSFYHGSKMLISHNIKHIGTGTGKKKKIGTVWFTTVIIYIFDQIDNHICITVADPDLNPDPVRSKP
jgi:hypothetical protein